MTAGTAGQRPRPLAGRTVLVPRAPAQAAALADRIRALGGEPLVAPTIEILPGDRRALAAAVADLVAGGYVAVCFTSPNGVAAFADVAAEHDAVGSLRGVTVAAVGPGTTAALERDLGTVPDVVPPRSTTAALAESFPPGEGRVLLPRADIATATLPDGLRRRGYEPVEVVAYRTGRPDGLPADVARRLADGEVDLVAFTSASTARNFAALVAGQPWRAQVVSIGPVTTAACAGLGIDVAAEADAHDLDGLVAALVQAARGQGAGSR